MKKAEQKNGLTNSVSNDEYHSGDGISKTGLDKIAESPGHYKIYREHPKPSTDAMRIGHAFHALVLEPDKFDSMYSVLPEDAPRKLTKAQLTAKKPADKTLEQMEWWEEWDKTNAGKFIIGNTPGDDPFWSPGEWDCMRYMRDALMAHPSASALLSGNGRFEHSAFWTDKETGLLSKCRPDFLNDEHQALVDLKTTVNASYSEFARSCEKYRYHVADAWYTDGLAAIGMKYEAMFFVAIEKTPPWGIGCYALAPDSRSLGRDLYLADMAVYAECMETDVWPVYPTPIRDLELPSWAFRPRIV